MSEVREHNNSTLLSMDNKMNPEPQVGDMVRNFYQSKQIGVVIEVIDRVQSKVLWGEYTDPYSGFIGAPRNINYSDIGRKLFTVEPMPQGAIPFYLDHMCKDVKD